ncbi:hypothetical protein MSPP1_002798 [Malassezia sp. CBS 17886]|nr:hypothetical protein MSPP1_002798 [Malassezia sp. CBS 17886]
MPGTADDDVDDQRRALATPRALVAERGQRTAAAVADEMRSIQLGADALRFRLTFWRSQGGATGARLRRSASMPWLAASRESRAGRRPRCHSATLAEAPGDREWRPSADRVALRRRRSAPAARQHPDALDGRVEPPRAEAADTLLVDGASRPAAAAPGGAVPWTGGLYAAASLPPRANVRKCAQLVDALCRRDAQEEDAARGVRNVAMALELLSSVCESNRFFASVKPYNDVLQRCAARGLTQYAVSALELLEQNVLVTKDADTYRLLIDVFRRDTVTAYAEETRAEQRRRRVLACAQVFETFERVAGAIAVVNPGASGWSEPQRARVWVAMLEAHFALGDAAAAVALFERMIAVQPTAVSTPSVDETVVATMVMGFVGMGDERRGIEWLQQLHTANLPLPRAHLLDGIVAAILRRPLREQAPPLAQLCDVLMRHSDVIVTGTCNKLTFSCIVHLARALENAHAWDTLPTRDRDLYLGKLHRLVAHVFTEYGTRQSLQNKQQAEPISAVLRLTAQLAVRGRAEEAAAFFALCMKTLRYADSTSLACVALLRSACHLPMAIADAAVLGGAEDPRDASASPATPPTEQTLMGWYAPPSGSPPWRTRALSASCVRFCAMARLVTPAMDPVHGPLADAHNAALVRLYEAAQRDLAGDLAPLALTRDDWQRVVDRFGEGVCASRNKCLASSALRRLIAQLHRVGMVRGLDLGNVRALVRGKYGDQGAAELDGWLAHARVDVDTSPLRTPAVCAPRAESVLPPVHSVEPTLVAPRSYDREDAQQKHEAVTARLPEGRYPTPSAMGPLMSAWGRLGAVHCVDELYAIGQHVLAARAADAQWCMAQWHQLEDAMITALSHAACAGRAATHHARLIGAGLAPSARSYAARIATTRERTDDAVVAETLFLEAKQMGVRPTTYLYNTVISKLSRARKTEPALRLLDEMQQAGLQPSSVTYGAAINACVRTGDAARATALFAEMEAQPSFQPRVPPYNTMLQYYVYSQPDREQALHYFEKMQQAGVRPSAHTYKLLLDVWGAIEPVRPDRQQAVFARLAADRLVRVEGTHWASLIRTHGVVLYDLARAMETFESIAERAPTAVGGGARGAPDAVVFEALFAVFIAHGRTDLMPAYVARMVDQGIFPTAYIANQLIDGYAQDGPMGLVEARRVFDAMSDPPAGVASAGNHANRRQGAGVLGHHIAPPPSSLSLQDADPPNVLGIRVNREPSTYEAMIRAELLYGCTGNAASLIDRMQAQ